MNGYCAACGRETNQTIPTERWAELQASDTSPVTCCQGCQLDIALGGRVTGKGWQWFKAELARRGVVIVGEVRE
jgi:hypothetical protein